MSSIWHNPLILSTIPHYFSVLPFVQIGTCDTYKWYITTLLASSTLSVLYHATNEANKIIAFLDYLAAFVWFSSDLYYSITLLELYSLLRIIFINCASFMINVKIPRDEKYILYHSIWHIINASKCYYVSIVISSIQ